MNHCRGGTKFEIGAYSEVQYKLFVFAKMHSKYAFSSNMPPVKHVLMKFRRIKGLELFYRFIFTASK